MYKTSHYEYSTSSNAATNGGVGQVRGGSADVPPNINSLDSLLLDLKHERERSLERAGESEGRAIIHTHTRGNKLKTNDHDGPFTHGRGRMPCWQSFKAARACLLA